MKSDDMLNILGDLDDTLITRADIGTKKRRLPRTFGILLAAVLLCTAVSAATYRLWSPGLVNFFGAKEPEQEALLDQGATSLVYNEPITLESGLVLQVQQILYDGQELTISICYQSPEEGWFTEDALHTAAMNTIPALQIGSERFPCTSSGFEQTATTVQTAYLICRFQGDFAKADGEAASLTLSPAVTDGKVTDAALVPAEPIQVSWTLNLSEAATKSIAGPFEAAYDDNAISIDNITISPVSIRFAAIEDEELISTAYPIGVRLRDGTLVPFTSGYTGTPEAVKEGEAAERLSAYYVFASPVLELDQISDLVFASFSEQSGKNEEPDIAFSILLR